MVFLIGLLGGAFLVLKSTVTKGTVETSTDIGQGKSSDELLDELLRINQNEAGNSGEYVPPENKNLTEDFLNTIVDKSNGETINPQEIASNDFFVSTILPYLKSNQLNLFPIIPDSSLKIVPDSKAAQQKYYKDTNKDILIFYNIMKSNLSLNPDKITDEAVLAGIDDNVAELGLAFRNLSRVEVPEKFTEIHKNVLTSVFSLQKFLEALTNSETDPLKSLLVINEAENLGEFWKQTLYDYTQLPESKRK